jgi:hypothetical protein
MSRRRSLRCSVRRPPADSSWSLTGATRHGGRSDPGCLPTLALLLMWACLIRVEPLKDHDAAVAANELRGRDAIAESELHAFFENV